MGPSEEEATESVDGVSWSQVAKPASTRARGHMSKALRRELSEDYTDSENVFEMEGAPAGARDSCPAGAGSPSSGRRWAFTCNEYYALGFFWLAFG